MNNNKDSKIENSLPVNIDQIRCDAFEAGFLAVYSGDYPQQALRNAQLQFNAQSYLAVTAKV